MLGCIPVDIFPSRGKDENCHLRDPTTIEIQTFALNNTETWRLAVLSSNPKSHRSKVSRRLYTEILGQTAEIDEKRAAAAEAGECSEGEEEIYKDAELVWCMMGMRSVHTTKFAVSSTYDPPYDVVLGKEDSRRYKKLNKPKGRHRTTKA